MVYGTHLYQVPHPLISLYNHTHNSATGIVGVLFTDRLEAGFSVMRSFLAAGFLIGFFTARSDVCTAYQLWGYFTMILLAVGTCTTLAILTKKKHQLLPCCFKKRTQPTNEITDTSLRETSEAKDSSLKEIQNNDTKDSQF